jgi:hypothetical protein
LCGCNSKGLSDSFIKELKRWSTQFHMERTHTGRMGIEDVEAALDDCSSAAARSIGSYSRAKTSGWDDLIEFPVNHRFEGSTMPRQPRRRISISDAMLLTAATAVGLTIARTYSVEVLRNNLAPYPSITRSLLTAWMYILATLPLPALWSLALLALWLRLPRPPRRLVRQPGAVACGAASLVIAVRVIGFLTLLIRKPGTPFMTVTLLWDRFAVTLSHPGPVNFSTVYTSAYFAASAFGMSTAVAAAWMLLARSGRWRSEAGWLDRAGRLLGAYWVGIIPSRAGGTITSSISRRIGEASLRFRLPTGES